MCRRLVQQVPVFFQGNLPAYRPLLGQDLLFDDAGEVVEEDRPQPADQLLFALTAELLKVAAGLQESLLHDVGRVAAGLEMEIYLRAGQEIQIVAVQLEKGSQFFAAALTGVRDQPICVLPSEWAHEVRTPPLR